jgi:ABC-type bacteriocin/lantibiotic exporter with double-glycine peptidase domain
MLSEIVVFHELFVTLAHMLLSIQGDERIIVINQGELYESGDMGDKVFRSWNMPGRCHR